MLVSRPLDYLPIWAIFGLTVAVVLFAIEAGYRIGKARRLHYADELDAPVAAIVAASLGLLGLIVAFTFSLAASRFDARRQMVVEEANAVGTTYLRTGLLPDGHSEKIRKLLAEYVEARLEVVQTGDVDLVLRRSNELHRQLWKEAEAVGRMHPNSIVVGLFIQALNETIDVHSKRVLVGLRSRLPNVLWVILYLITVATMFGVGYHEGLSKSRRSLVIIVLVFVFSAIITLVTDLDRPQEGFFTVSQQTMVDLRSMIDSLPSSASPK
ncbi:MAG: DUF4239 domain-containing protein [Planctomycetia bacterium]|nr:DUF4239 domain-containing protein [Planctomycetia bacterium]